MTVLSGQTLKNPLLKYRDMITPFVDEKTVYKGMSYGVSHAGYDIRIAETVDLWAQQFKLAGALEYFKLRNDVIGFVHDKSSWARQGISLFNTVLEPGWEGYLTLELYNTSDEMIRIEEGSPIAQIIFMELDEPVDGYKGKYQGQERGQGVIFE